MMLKNAVYRIEIKGISNFLIKKKLFINMPLDSAGLHNIKQMYADQAHGEHEENGYEDNINKILHSIYAASLMQIPCSY